MNPRWIVAVYILNEHQRFSPSRPLSSDFCLRPTSARQVSATRRALGTGDPLPPSLPSALRFDAASRYGATSAADFISKFILGGGDKSRLREEVEAIVRNPSAFVDDPVRKDFAKALISTPHGMVTTHR
jgi:hypothetical protein